MAKTTKKRSTPHRVNTHKSDGSRSSSREVAPAKRPRQPRQADLPGTEDRAISALENVANDYVEIRDQRMELSRQEHPLKDKLLKLMKKHGKQAYRRDGISIEVVTTQETVKVKIKKPGEDDDEGPGDVDIEPSGGDEDPDESEPVADGEEATD